MTIATITEAQRETIRSTADALEQEAQKFAQDARVPGAAHITRFDGVANAAVAALAVAGYNGTLSTQFVLNSGVKVPATLVSGSGNFATPTIVAGVITGIVLSAS